MFVWVFCYECFELITTDLPSKRFFLFIMWKKEEKGKEEEELVGGDDGEYNYVRKM